MLGTDKEQLKIIKELEGKAGNKIPHLKPDTEMDYDTVGYKTDENNNREV
jgi:hypothetical protein